MTLHEAATKLGEQLRAEGVPCCVGVADPYRRIHVYLERKEDKGKPPKSYYGYAVDSRVMGRQSVPN